MWPVVWVDEGADANQENLDLLKSMLVKTSFTISLDIFLPKPKSMLVRPKKL